jgi:hypothetical protein
MMCWGMKAKRSRRPGANLTSVDRFAMAAVTNPAAMVPRAPIVSRAIIIGSVNVMASATRA